MADVSVRIAWAEDVPAIARLQVAHWRTSYGDAAPAELLRDDAEEAVADQWRASLRRPPDARNRVLVALEHDRVTGLAVTGPSTDPDRDPGPDGEISELLVAEADRRTGHGSRLLQAAVDTLVADGFSVALLWLGTEADEARRFVTDAGWQADGAFRELAAPDGSQLRQVRLHTAIGG